MTDTPKAPKPQSPDIKSYGSDVMNPTIKAEIDRQHDVVPGENHHHTDANPAVISATEARGGAPNGAGFTINWVSTLLIAVGVLAVLLIWLR